MCGRYTVTKSNKVIEITFNVTTPADLHLVGRWNVAPSQQVPVITAGAGGAGGSGSAVGGGRELGMMRWGLIPSWAKNPKVGNGMINARAETLGEKAAYRAALAKRRCVIPADGFYEWKKGAGKKGKKVPMYIRLRGGELFAFAGLWETWINGAGEAVRSCTIITTAPNALLEGIHDRMPAMLTPAACERWLRGPAGEAVGLLRPYPAEEMEAYAVGPLVNSVQHEGAELVAAAVEEEAEQAAAGQRGLFEM